MKPFWMLRSLKEREKGSRVKTECWKTYTFREEEDNLEKCSVRQKNQSQVVIESRELRASWRRRRLTVSNAAKFEIYNKNTEFGLSDNSWFWIISISLSPTQLTSHQKSRWFHCLLKISISILILMEFFIYSEIEKEKDRADFLLLLWKIILLNKWQ